MSELYGSSSFCILFYFILTQENSGELKTLHKEESVYVRA
jgi:hypothetical protein